jgi:hypothetical protein
MKKVNGNDLQTAIYYLIKMFRIKFRVYLKVETIVMN